jgi:hypothetical protein
MPIQRKVTRSIAKAMFDLYKSETPISQIARTLRISHVTIRKIKARDKWDKRIEDLRHKAQKYADEKAAYSLANELTQINALIPIVLNSLLHRIRNPRACPECSGSGKIFNRNCTFCEGKGSVRILDVNVADFERLVRLKRDTLEVVQPELPAASESKEPVAVDRYAQILDRIDQATNQNIEALGDLIAQDILKQRQRDRSR